MRAAGAARWIVATIAATRLIVRSIASDGAMIVASRAKESP